MHMTKKLVSLCQSRRASLCILSRRLPVGRRLLESTTPFRQTLRGYHQHSTAHLAWCVMSGSSSFRRAISVCMNLLYAVSFLRPPPPEDLATVYVSQGRPLLARTSTHFSSPAFRLLPSFPWALTGSGPLTVGQMKRVDLNHTDDAWL